MKKPVNDVLMALLTVPSLIGVLWTLLVISHWPFPNDSAIYVRAAPTMFYLPPFELVTGFAAFFFFRVTTKSLPMICCGFIAVLGVIIGGFGCLFMYIVLTDFFPHPR